MHPNLLHALARERQAELLRHNQFRYRRRLDMQLSARVGSNPRVRLRQFLGTLLVHAGARLLDTAAPMEIASNRE
jgi:hypothetical protein